MRVQAGRNSSAGTLCRVCVCASSGATRWCSTAARYASPTRPTGAPRATALSCRIPIAYVGRHRGCMWLSAGLHRGGGGGGGVSLTLSCACACGRRRHIGESRCCCSLPIQQEPDRRRLTSRVDCTLRMARSWRSGTTLCDERCFLLSTYATRVPRHATVLRLSASHSYTLSRILSHAHTPCADDSLKQSTSKRHRSYRPSRICRRRCSLISVCSPSLASCVGAHIAISLARTLTFGTRSNHVRETRSTGESDSGAWFNAILSRFWWNLHENPHFRQLIMNSLGKRISRMTNFPKFIVRRESKRGIDRSIHARVLTDSPTAVVGEHVARAHLHWSQHPAALQPVARVREQARRSRT